MSRKPIDVEIHAGPRDDDGGGDSGVDPARFRDALANHATAVTLVAVRDGGDVHGTTVSAFVSVSAEPPLIAVSLGPGAQVLPFLDEGRPFAISFLAREQSRLATLFADSFPVGPSPFPEEGPPIVDGALFGLVCTVRSVVPVAASRVIVARVEDVEPGRDGDPLLYFQREYRGLD